MCVNELHLWRWCYLAWWWWYTTRYYHDNLIFCYTVHWHVFNTAIMTFTWDELWYPEYTKSLYKLQRDCELWCQEWEWYILVHCVYSWSIASQFHGFRISFCLVSPLSTADSFRQLMAMSGWLLVAMFYTMDVLRMYTSSNLTRFYQNIRGYLKNHWTNTRLVCTHLNAEFSYRIQIWQWKFGFWKFLRKSKQKKKAAHRLQMILMWRELKFPCKSLWFLVHLYQDCGLVLKFMSEKTGDLSEQQ